MIDTKYAGDEDVESDARTRKFATLRVMAQIYKDIHASSFPKLVQNTSDLAEFFNRENRNFENQRQTNIALQTQAMFRVIEYTISWENIRNEKDSNLSNNISIVINHLSGQTDELSRASITAKV